MEKNLTIKPIELPFLYRLLKPLEKHRLSKVREMIVGNNLTVLEIGCADGKFLYDNRDKWGKIEGVDTQIKSLEKAKERNYQIPARFQKLDFGRKAMPYNSCQFDLVVSIATLQYVYNLDLLFGEAHRVLKPNGLFIFEVPNVAVFWRRMQLLFGRLPNTSQFITDLVGGVIHYFTQHDLSVFLKQTGFEIEKISCSGIFDNWRSRWVSLLGADLIFVCRKI